jgi:hypothetical protein
LFVTKSTQRARAVIVLPRHGTAGRFLCLILLLALSSVTTGSEANRPNDGCPGTLEDIYGDTGNTFQAAIGFVNFEGTLANQARQSYGIAVDDMVVKWKEFVLESDITDCAVSGSCAVVELATNTVFQGETVLTVTLLENTPDAANDCDLDGTPDATVDCNGNGTPDLVVKATSEAELTGEIVILDSVGGSEYKGIVTVSSLGDGPGVLFIAQQGAENPTVTVTYLDSDIDPGPAVEICPNDVDPAKHGLVQAFTSIFLGATCEVTIVSTALTDNGDGDVYADTEETVDMQVCIVNNCGEELHNCTGRLFSNSPEVDCILDATIDMGDLADSDEIVCITDAFRWKVTDVNRGDVSDDLGAEFVLTMTCDEIDALSVRQDFGMQLDLDLDDLGQTPTAWLESFEGGDLASSAFYAENLDAGIPGNNNTEGHLNGDGWRCQYHDPDWPNSNTYGNDTALDCYPGMSLDQSNAVWWQVDGIDTGSSDGGRAKSGSHSLYYGSYLVDPPEEFTTPLAAVESAATITPINLGVGSPELSWWHQISLMNDRYLQTPSGTSADRGVAQYRTVNLAGDDTSVWMNLQPFQNTYDQQAYQNYYSCMFDPVDDGTTEDDFLDPTDPERRLGPSSTCFPEFSYACMGDTDNPFQVQNICNATKAPSAGDAGALGVGTWVQSKVDLRSLRGRRIHLRFLVSSLKITAETWDDQFANVNPGPWDDGWWIDDVTIDETLSNPALLLVDDDILRHCTGDPAMGCLTDQDCVDAGTAGPCTGEAPQCPETCTSITVQVATDPDNTGGALDELLTAPGQPIELDASSSFGTCLDGALQFRFSKDGGTTILREFSENPVLTAAPQDDTDYLVEVRCSTDTTCSDSATVDVNVNCPASGNLGGIFPTIVASTKTTWVWTPPKTYVVWQGDVTAVSTYGGTQSFSGSGDSFTDVATPAVGSGDYYLAREVGEFCNDDGLWTSGGPAESPLREPSLP